MLGAVFTALLVAACSDSSGPLATVDPGSAPERSSAEPAFYVPPLGLWMGALDVQALPTSGPAWENVKGAADSDCGVPDLSDQNQDTNVCILAKALVFVRTGEEAYRSDVVEAIAAIVESGPYRGRALSLGRELAAYVLSADLVRLPAHRPALDAGLRAKLRELRTARTRGGPRSLIDCHEQRPNAWGTHCGASRAAIAAYLRDTRDLERTAAVFKGWLGDRDSYAGFRYGDLSWQCDPNEPVGINPAGCLKDGHPVGGVLPDDQRRAGKFTWPPPKANPVYEALQGALVTAVILERRGYDAFSWENSALLRAFRWLHDQADFQAVGDDTWQPHLINQAYGADFPAEVPARHGKNVGWTDWTAGSGSSPEDPPDDPDEPASNEPPTARFTARCEELSCEFDGSSSTDDHGIRLYSWSFGDGTEAQGVAVVHTYPGAGTFTVRLTVEDEGDLSSTTTGSVEITEASPPPPPPPPDEPPIVQGIWIGSEELAALPTTGAAWDNVKDEADGSCGTPDVSDQNDNANVCVMAKALVFARTGIEAYRTDVVSALRSVANEGTYEGRALALGRELVAYVIAADLVSLSSHDPALDAAFRDKLRELRTTPTTGAAADLVDCHEKRPNNWGNHCGASRAAIAAYLGDQAELERTAQVFKGYLGDRGAYAGFKYGSDLSWQCDPDRPVGINPVGCTKDGHPIGGVLPDDQRRGGSFAWPPPQENYVYEGLQGALAMAVILHRRGYDAFSWEDEALLRAFRWLHDQADFEATGDDEWQPHVINHFYGTGFPAKTPARHGKNVGWTDWTLTN